MQAAALVRLWGMGHVEQVRPPVAPFHILAQQIMALSLQYGGIGDNDWRNELQGVSAFRAMDEGDRSSMVAHMLATGILHDDQGILWLGAEGEAEYGFRHFMELFTAFVSEPLVAVRHGDRHIGNVHHTTFARWPENHVVLVLGGHSWKVTHVDWKQRSAYVAPSGDEGRSKWAGTGQPIRYELCQAMRDVLLGAELPATLTARATQALSALRQEFQWLEAGTTTIEPMKGAVRWWTFGGLFANSALAAACKSLGSGVAAPNNLSIKVADASGASVLTMIDKLRDRSAGTIVPDLSAKAVEGLKFNECLPMALACRVLRDRMTDSRAVQAVLAEPVKMAAP
jgi:ATP-dependent Lhr-like helicase